MALCDINLTQDIYAIECNPVSGATNLSVKGVKRNGLIFNRADFDPDPSERVTFTRGGNCYSVLPLLEGKRGYHITQPANNPFEGTKTEASKGKYVTTFNHTLQFVILNHGNYTAAIIDELANGEFVVMLEPNQSNNEPATQTSPIVAVNGAWEVYGLDNGLKLETAVRELYNDDTLAGWLVTMTETGAPNAATFVKKDVIASYPVEDPTSEDDKQTT